MNGRNLRANDLSLIGKSDPNNNPNIINNTWRILKVKLNNKNSVCIGFKL